MGRFKNWLHRDQPVPGGYSGTRTARWQTAFPPYGEPLATRITADDAACAEESPGMPVTTGRRCYFN